MSLIAKTPRPPYYAVIFTSVRSSVAEGYLEAAQRMIELAELQPGFLGVESARENLGLTVSYWESLEAIKAWKGQAEHQEAQRNGKLKWYDAYCTRIAKVERDYSGPNGY